MPSQRKHFDTYQGQHVWFHCEAYIAFWVKRIVERLALDADKRLLDLGSGDGDLAHALYEASQARVLCVEPSAMGDQTPAPLERVPAEALSFLRTNTDSFDAILLKQMIHHIRVADRPELARCLYDATAQGGRVLVLTMPPSIEFPIFEAAQAAFLKYQIHYTSIETLLKDAGFSVCVEKIEYPVSIAKNDYFQAIRERFISDLRDFSERELEAGIAQIDAQHLEEMMQFSDALYAVMGERL